MENTKIHLFQWNNVAGDLLERCKKAGSAICMPVHYENLVLHPRQTLMKIMDFAEMPWNNNLMEHQNHINNDLATSEEVRNFRKKSFFFIFSA